MEKLLDTVNGGTGNGDAVLEAVEVLLFSTESSEFFDPNGPFKPEDVVGLLETKPGGLGSSCSSLILGGDAYGGEWREDVLGDDG